MSGRETLQKFRVAEAAQGRGVHYYERFHAGRLDTLLKACLRCSSRRDARVLDVGPTAFSVRLLDHYDDVSTLGMPLGPNSLRGVTRADGRRQELAQHIVYDLNDAQRMVPIEAARPFEVALFAEVLEHLHTAPELVLSTLRSVLEPGGHLIVQTPNAAALYKRLLLVAGIHPYELIRVDARNPGHFREYTKRELVAYARKTDFEVVSHAYTDGMGGAERFGGAVVLAGLKALGVLVPPFARGQTLILRRPPRDTR